MVELLRLSARRPLFKGSPILNKGFPKSKQVSAIFQPHPGFEKPKKLTEGAILD
jgi:hypothetical protein